MFVKPLITVKHTELPNGNSLVADHISLMWGVGSLAGSSLSCFEIANFKLVIFENNFGLKLSIDKLK